MIGREILLQVQDIPTDPSVEFVKDPETTIAKLRQIKSGLSDLAETHMPIMAYTVLLASAINHLTHSQNKMFYFPIPWEVGTGLPSHPSLIADARHYCRSSNLSNTTGIVVDSFAEWRLLNKQEQLCCCGKKHFSLTSLKNLEKLLVSIEVVIHHPISIDRESNTLKIKQLVGVRSTDRGHIENHYNLRRDSRIDKNIAIIRTAFTSIGIENMELHASGEECAEQFDIDLFRKIFTELCSSALMEPI